ncbi:MAG: hypothetical protein JXB23_15610 [Candidatus Aminicenantes bacterium]|nr:hypothetical protein [Candidatus Aminicenantes bacterium]
MLDICPLLLIAIKTIGPISEMEEKQARCLRGECAWYVGHSDPEKAGCALKVLSNSMIAAKPGSSFE